MNTPFRADLEADMIAVTTSDTVLLAGSDYPRGGSHAWDLPPLARAAVIARLRTLADLLETEGTTP
jgi:hypothetical protein